MAMYVPRMLLVVAVLAINSSAVHADQKSHRQAAEGLLKEMGVDKQLENSISQMLDIQIKANPSIAPLRPTMKTFYSKYLSWASLKEDYITIYCDAFSEAELTDLFSFYKTPTGKKLIEKMPEITSKGMQLGAQRVQANMGELRQMIQEASSKPATPPQ